MSRIATDELGGIDAAFAGNRLLSTFPADTRALIEPFGEVVELAPDSTVHERGSSVELTYFPFGPAMVSLVVELSGNRSLEVASIGHEGAVGGIVSCGHAPAFGNAKVLVPGLALRVPMRAIDDAKARSAHLRNLFCRYSDFLLSQVMQSVACNTFHPIEQRAARWLLIAQDRAGSTIELTQESLAGLLGVQRTTVNAVVKTLADEGLISIRRGMIQIVDRAGLKKRSCECYDAVERHFEAVIGPSGVGGDEECA